jgi:hypothetical protein
MGARIFHRHRAGRNRAVGRCALADHGADAILAAFRMEAIGELARLGAAGVIGPKFRDQVLVRRRGSVGRRGGGYPPVAPGTDPVG